MTKKDFCDAPITSDKVLFAVHHLKLNKSPGVDIWTSEFDIAFTEQFVHSCMVCVQRALIPPPTLSQGLLSLIGKPKKDSLCIHNWWPICLLHNDHRILAQIYAKRTKAVLDQIIDETQSGFMRHSHVSDNIRPVILIDCADHRHVSDNIRPVLALIDPYWLCWS